MSTQGVGVKKRRSRSEWRTLLVRYSRSELTVARFCRQEGTSPASFYRWRSLLGKNQESGSVSLPDTSESFVDLGPLDVPSPSAGQRLEIKLELGNGLVLHLVRG